MKRVSVFSMVMCALFAALTAVLSQIQIPIGPVPINLALLSVFLAGGILGWRCGALSQLVYVLAGAVGVPVFAGFSGGFGVAFGPTGGFILSYILCALLIGWLCERFGRKIRTLALAMGAALVLCYLLGCLWFVFTMKSTFAYAVSVCVTPFVVFDLIKISLATVLSVRLYPEYDKISRNRAAARS